MKAVFAQSINSYLAKGPDDDMSWTPSLDKKIFKLLTLVCNKGICICSKNTYSKLPIKMLQSTGRQFIVAEKQGAKTLRSLNGLYPEAILIGGPRFLKAAYDEGVIDTFVITTINIAIEEDERYKNPFWDLMPKLKSIGNIRIDGMHIEVFNNESKLK